MLAANYSSIFHRLFEFTFSAEFPPSCRRSAVWLFWLWIVFYVFNLVAVTNSKWGLHRHLVTEPHNLLIWWQVQVDVDLKIWDQAWGYVFENIWHWEILSANFKRISPYIHSKKFTFSSFLSPKIFVYTLPKCTYPGGLLL